ncbi:MAG: hypothetical protein H8E98_04545 [Bacteroidetes bacterium]|nr:hypothetical protein [Bacteroidota bacterium]
MKLKKKYVVGCHFMFYEVEMLPEYVDGLLNMLTDIENPEMVTFDICFNTSEYFEKMMFSKEHYITSKYIEQIDRLNQTGCIVNEVFKTNDDPVYNIPSYRRDLNNNYANEVEYVIWGESDSVAPAQTFQIIEQIDENVSTKKHIITFSYRKLWDESFKQMEHPKFTNEIFQDTEEWTLHNEASEKSTMSIQRMNEINNETEDIDVKVFKEPKFDGSFPVISSELIKSGVQLPHSLLLCGEDTAFAENAKRIMGDNYVQYHVSNILRVHNRRNPRKRNYIVDEYNPCGFCGEEDKGPWWKIIEKMSKENLANINNPNYKSWTYKDFFEKMKK